MKLSDSVTALRAAVAPLLAAALLAAALLMAAVLLGTAPVRADPASEAKAFAFIEVLTAEALGLVDSLEGDAFDEQFGAFIMRGFDVATVGRIAMGPYWRRASPEQQTEYQSLFNVYIVATYAARFRQFSGEVLRVEETLGIDEDETIVTTQFVRPNDPNIRIDWHVRTGAERDVVLDVIVEGLRLTRTLRDEFSDVIRIGGGDIDVLLQRLRERNAEFAAGGA